MYQVLGFRKFDYEIEIDITDKKKFIQNYKNMFVLLIVLISLLLIILYIYIQKFYKTNWNYNTKSK